MGRIQLQTLIDAPIERCFDLSRSVDVHLLSSTSAREKVIAGTTSGLMSLHDEVTWEARHFGIKQRLRTRIVEMNPPYSFTDIQVSGIFHQFSHIHIYRVEDGKTAMIDDMTFQCPFGFVGRLFADRIVTNHLRNFLIQRNQEIKRIAETQSAR